MPSWGEILNELVELERPDRFDIVRRKYLKQLHEHTKRNVILYATAWTQGKMVDPEILRIGDEDMQGFMEATYGIGGGPLDLIIHSPGGSPEATEALVNYIRSKFDPVYAFVPHAAMSAATMFACAANKIWMAKHSSLGPIDPQLLLNTQLGRMAVPAQAIKDQFERGKKECEEKPANLAPWLPILTQYGPSLLIQCDNALTLAQELISEWLEKYMFLGHPAASEMAKQVANKLADHGEFKSHYRHISREKAEKIGLAIDHLEIDQALQDLVLSVFHATMHTFAGTNAAKIVENHLGKAWIRGEQPVLVKAPPPAPPSTPFSAPQPSRSER